AFVDVVASAQQGAGAESRAAAPSGRRSGDRPPPRCLSPPVLPAAEQLRPRADAFVRSRTFRGAPNPQFESARPTEYLSRTDWKFRYRVSSSFPTGDVVPYLYVYFAGEQFAGCQPGEEYANGSQFR